VLLSPNTASPDEPRYTAAHMDRDRFEQEVLALAGEGTKLTVANVAARTKLPLRKAETMLDDLVKAGHAESDIDEDVGVIVYRVRGLSPKGRVRLEDAVGDARDRAMRAASEVIVKQAASRAKATLLAAPRAGEKSILIGAVLGLFLGPLGLLYAAPWATAIIASAVYMLAWWLPLVKWIMGAVALAVHVGSALASAGYVWRFNQQGKRAPLLPPDTRRALKD
jgi:hypothetical protein